MMNAMTLLSFRQSESDTPLYPSAPCQYQRTREAGEIPASGHRNYKTRREIGIYKKWPSKCQRIYPIIKHRDCIMLSRDKMTWSLLALSAFFFHFQPGHTRLSCTMLGALCSLKLSTCENR